MTDERTRDIQSTVNFIKLILLFMFGYLVLGGLVTPIVAPDGRPAIKKDINELKSEIQALKNLQYEKTNKPKGAG